MRIGIRDLVNPGSGMGEIGSGINIPDPQHCSLQTIHPEIFKKSVQTISFVLLLNMIIVSK
jgi:hypothetical protein